MATWGFLGGHIAHELTQSSDRFSPTPSHRSSSSESSHSVHSLIRRRNLGMVKRKRTGTEDTTLSNVPEDDDTTIKDLLNEAKKIMERRKTTGVEAEIQDFATYLCSRLRKVARRNYKVLFPQILALVSLVEEEPGDEQQLPTPARATPVSSEYFAIPSPAGPPPGTASAPAVAVTTTPSPSSRFPVSLDMMIPSVTTSPSVVSISSSKSVLETPKVTRPVNSDEDDD
ncbi:hypothetical protein E2C01_012485 [Portunus trituberculatus]|uniref:Uncharacterized protein n=1 Tax=Portunus trituberculatus TaxID=210409 RepID=A0A5B7DEC7_PORTR|nr:hypothetical protein [Portunus trituberculatus]